MKPLLKNIASPAAWEHLERVVALQAVAEVLEAATELLEGRMPPWGLELVVGMRNRRQTGLKTKTDAFGADPGSQGHVDEMVEDAEANLDAVEGFDRGKTSPLARMAPEGASPVAATAGRDLCLCCESKDLLEREAREKRYEALDEPLEAPEEAVAADAEPAEDVEVFPEPASAAEVLLEDVDVCPEVEEREELLPQRRRWS